MTSQSAEQETQELLAKADALFREAEWEENYGSVRKASALYFEANELGRRAVKGRPFDPPLPCSMVSNCQGIRSDKRCKGCPLG